MKSPSRGLAGAILMVLGAAGLIALQIAVSSDTAPFGRLQIALGLAGAPLLSALAQGLLLVGAWLIWSAFRRES